MNDESNGDRPLYRQVADRLRQRIESGEFQIGAQLPTEGAVCEAYEISRHTARDALRLLAEAGLIQRRQGSGSLVIASTPPKGYVHSMRSLDELFQYAADTTLRYSAIGPRIPGPEFAADVGPGYEGEWLLAEGLRLDAGGQIPISHVLIWLNNDFASMADKLPGIRGAIYAQVEERFGVEVSEVEQVIRMEMAKQASATALGLRARSFVARVTRRYLDAGGRAFLVSVNYHPAERFSYSMRLRRDGPKGGWS